MEKTKVTLGEWFMDDNGNELSSQVLGSIMTYAYGEAKNISQISKYIGLHPVQTILYLDYLVGQGLLKYEEKRVSDMIEKQFVVNPQSTNLEMHIKLSDQNGVMELADRMCMMLRDGILSLEDEDLNDLSCYVGAVPVRAIMEIIDQIKMIQEKVEHCEDEMEPNEDAKKYMLMTAFAPYKE
ncbi:MAG: hypothetical protein K2N34_13460 [Lachnospiraceae bacterium]|nr:hypothetical protein [Lachnospiraceae bacterium]